MKTSTKFLIVLFACIPLSLLAYNYLLNKQYDAGRFVQKFTIPEPQTSSTNLPSFKHIVVNGNLMGNVKSTSVKGQPVTYSNSILSWMPKIAIEGKRLKGPASAEVMKMFEDYVGFQVRNDTLYITFRSDDRNGPDFRFNDYGLNLIKVYSSKLETISCENGNYTISGDSFADSLKVNASGEFSNYRFSDLKLNYLILNLRDSTKASIEDNSIIQELSYSLKDRAHLSIESPARSVVRLNPGTTDSTNVISLSGHADEMKKYLPKGKN